MSALEGLEPCYEIPEGLEDAIANGDDDTVDELSQGVKWNKSANGYRLPMEAEWEYCACGGEEHLYSGSDDIDEVAWYGGNSGRQTHGVGQKKANGYGLYDMSGNVWEWVWDSGYREYGSSVTEPVYIDTSSPNRVFRGGSWDFSAWNSRVSLRVGYDASLRLNDLGFRFLRTIP